MSEAPEDLRYTESHEWVKTLEDGTVEIGVTDHAQQALGDLVFVDLPEVGNTYATGEECAVVESVKAASDMFCPVGGKVVAVNELLSDAPETINHDPYGEGWIFRVEPEVPFDQSSMLDADAYLQQAEAAED
jgi:glycine cleavage system H protein